MTRDRTSRRPEESITTATATGDVGTRTSSGSSERAAISSSVSPSGDVGASASDVDEGATPAEDSEVRGSELACENLSLGYHGELVVEGESLAVPAGEVTALVGPNGSGKSTLLKGLADQLDHQTGRVLLDGRDVREFGSKELARELGMLSQENEAPGSLSVEELAFRGRYPYRGALEPSDDDDREAVERALALAGVEELRDRELGSLSGGQKQLAWIAMVLAQDPDVLLLDEPTTFLDMQHQLAVLDVVERLRDEHGITVVVVLHDIEQAARRADHVVAMDDGEVRAAGAPADVLTPDLLADAFGVEASVTETAHGLQITPLGRTAGSD